MGFFAPLLLWWIIITLYGIGGLGLGRAFLRHLPDRGFGFPRMLGLIVGSWLAWLGCSLFLPYRFGTLALSLLVVAGAGGYLLYRERDVLLRDARELRWYLLASEVLFFAALMAWGYVRSYNPDIAGTEKFPDYAFMTSVMRSDTMPPEDPWFAGSPINYFYFGHFMMASMTTLSGLPSSVGFNCALCLLFALIAQGAGALGFSLTKSLKGFALAPLFVIFMGNLFPMYQHYTEAFVLPRAAEQYNRPQAAEWSNTDWWWHPSRVVLKAVPNDGVPLPGEEGGPPAAPGALGGLHRHVIEKFGIPGWRTVDETINEFPLWSFVLGDLHAHVMVVPVMILNLWLLLGLALAPGMGRTLLGEQGLTAGFMVLLAVTMGALPPTNYWELPAAILCLFVAVFTRHFGGWKFSAQRAFGAATLFLSTCIGMAALYAPFYSHFEAQTKEDPIAAVTSEHLTSFVHFFYIFGFFLFMIVAYYAFKALDAVEAEPYLFVLAVPFLIGLAGGALRGSFLFGTLLGLVLYQFYFTMRLRMRGPELFASALSIVAWCMIAGCELIVIKDFYGGALLRMNTLFKFYYQAWLLLGVSCSYFAFRALTDLFKPLDGLYLRPAYATVFGLFTLASLQYTFIGPAAKTNNFSAGGHIPTFDGIAYMSFYHRDDYGAIQWLRENTSGQPVILEAAGRAFSHYSRVSAATGLPSPLGWDNHQALWRDNTWASIRPRTQEINTIYRSTNWDEVARLLETYSIEFVYIGALERKKYSGPGLDKFALWAPMFELVHDQDNGQIYRVLTVPTTSGAS